MQKELNESKFRISLHNCMALRSFVASIYKLPASLNDRHNEDQVTFLGGSEILSGFLHSKIYARILEHHPRPGFTSGNY